MPDLEISRLPQIDGADLQGTDPLALADISASETKKVTVSALLGKSVDFIGNNSISSDQIISLDGAKLDEDSVGSTQIAENAVGSSELADGSVDTAAIQDNAVTDGKLATGIDGSKLTDGTVSDSAIVDLDGGKITDGTIGSDQLADESIGADQLADASVGTDAIADSAVTNAKLAGEIEGSKLKADTVTGSEIAQNAISSSELADDSVETDAVADGAITDDKIATGISGGKLTEKTVGTTQIADSAVTDDKLGSNLDGSKIKEGTIGSTELAAKSVTTKKIDDGAVTDAKIADGIDGSKISKGTIAALQLAASAVTTSAIKDGAVTDAKVAAGISGSKITDTTIPAAALGEVTDRGLDQTTGSIGIKNEVTAGSKSGITWDAQGLITDGTGTIPATDLPVATTSTIGAVQVPTTGGLSVDTAGAISITNAVTANTVRGIEYDAHGCIVSIEEAIPSTAVPIATADAVGGVMVPGPDLSIANDGTLTISDSTVTSGTYPTVSVNAKGIVTAGGTLSSTDVPELDASKITTGQFPSARIGTDSITATKIADYAISFIQEAIPALTTDLHIGMLWYQESTSGLHMFNGNSWMPISIGRLSQENLRYCGTINATTGIIDGITSFGTAAGYKIGDLLGSATDDRTGVYFVVSEPGSGILEPAVTGVAFDAGDWVLCNGQAAGFVRIDVLSSGGGGGGASRLNDLLDVTLTTPAGGQPLVYNSDTNQWINSTDIDGGVYFE